jgi:hypothetical protein
MVLILCCAVLCCAVLCPQTAIAATMFPHLCQRLFAAKSEAVMRRGMSMMNFRWGGAAVLRLLLGVSEPVLGWFRGVGCLSCHGLLRLPVLQGSLPIHCG